MLLLDRARRRERGAVQGALDDVMKGRTTLVMRISSPPVLEADRCQTPGRGRGAAASMRLARLHETGLRRARGGIERMSIAPDLGGKRTFAGASSLARGEGVDTGCDRTRAGRNGSPTSAARMIGRGSDAIW